MGCIDAGQERQEESGTNCGTLAKIPAAQTLLQF